MLWLLILCLFHLVAGQNNWQREECVQWAESVPEDLHAWVLGVMTVLSVCFVAGGSNQPLKQLKMPFLTHAMPTILVSVCAVAMLVASTEQAVRELFQPTSQGSRGCDVRRVAWTVTPIIIGTAGAGSLVVTAMAFRCYAIRSPVMERNDRSIRRTQLGIPPEDSYGNGIVAIKQKLVARLLVAIWVMGTLIGLFFALRGDVINGLFSIAGIIAVWSNIGLSPWNSSLHPSGFDTATENTSDFDCVEVNIWGDNTYQTAVVIQPTPRSVFSKSDPHGLMEFDGRIYGLSNAHAASTDFRGDAFQMKTYLPYLDDLDALAVLISQKANEAKERLARIFEKTDVMNPAHRGAFTALTAAILDKEAWIDYPREHRERFRATALAVAWAYRLCQKAGCPREYFNDRLSTNGTVRKCTDELCTNPIHRWLMHHELKETVEEEAKYLFGRDGAVQEFKDEYKDTVRELWSKVRDRMGAEHTNAAVLICAFLTALQAMGAFFIKDADYFPTFKLKIKPFTVEDFKEHCKGVNLNNFKFLPLIDANGSRREKPCSCEYNIKNTVTFKNERQVSVPFHPKVMFHVAVRVLWHAILVQVAAWSIMVLRLLVT